MKEKIRTKTIEAMSRPDVKEKCQKHIEFLNNISLAKKVCLCSFLIIMKKFS